MSKLTACVIAKNEEKNLKNCLNSLNFVDEIVLIDNMSVDKTNEIAKECKVKIYKYTQAETDFSELRNYAQSLASNDWILFLDADETISKKLSVEIQQTIQKSIYELIFIKRIDYFLKKAIKNGEVKAAAHKGFIRLYRKGFGRWIGKVHEVFLPYRPARSTTLKNYITHYPHQSVLSFLIKINAYSTIIAKNNKKKYYGSIFSILFFPMVKFLYTFFWLSGYKDRESGFIYSFMMSFHSFLARSKKL
jgi:glycosyltransferase involved in cell wall biosynthesis